MTKRENWLRLLHHDSPGWIADPWEAFQGDFMNGHIVTDPITQESEAPAVPGEFLDPWGVTWKTTDGHSFPNPFITEGNKAVKDITRWREQLVLPPLTGQDWTQAEACAAGVDRSEYLVGAMLIGGLFERTHYLMGFQDALVNYMLEPDHMYDLLGAIADWKLEHLRQVISHIHPDVIIFHDDWGTKESLFMHPDLWRQLIKPHQQRIVDCIKAAGIIYIHHSDSFCEPIVEDMAEMGMDAWQGGIPQNDIPAIQETLQGRMALIGGIDAQLIDIPDAHEELIRSEVRRCIDEYCPAGHFIPCIPNFIPIYPEVKAIYEDELASYGKDFFKRLH